MSDGLDELIKQAKQHLTIARVGLAITVLTLIFLVGSLIVKGCS